MLSQIWDAGDRPVCDTGRDCWFTWGYCWFWILVLLVVVSSARLLGCFFNPGSSQGRYNSSS
jgi:hypothetical protein